ncbi:MAG TPA: transcription antitermination factor NusB [Lichenihabitans sp.]|jgi:N utilization substance protein B|nr:transcription antitermination factor NusB [Lichenihabitans sp.]
MSRGEKRAAARLAAVQALYQMDVAKTGINEIFAEFESHWIGQEVEGEQYKPAEVAFFRATVEGVMAGQGEIDRLIDNALQEDWPLRRVEAVLRATLRAGTYELIGRKDIPVRVTIKEYTDVAGAFLEGDEVGMVNAVLDGLARRLRPSEMAGLARSG